MVMKARLLGCNMQLLHHCSQALLTLRCGSFILHAYLLASIGMRCRDTSTSTHLQCHSLSGQWLLAALFSNLVKVHVVGQAVCCSRFTLA
jgi:hypothetical protein